MFPMPILNQYGNIVIVHDPNIQGVITSGSTAPGTAAAENRFQDTMLRLILLLLDMRDGYGVITMDYINTIAVLEMVN